MISPWRNHLPTREYTHQRVVVYFYNGGWVPITFFSLEAAIELYRKAQDSGYEIFIFPENLIPEEFEQVEESMADLTYLAI